MLTKETKRTAEQIGRQLAPLFATAFKLGEKLRQAATETRKAHDIATAWQYPSHAVYANECGENSQEIQAMREQEPKKWHDVLYEKYAIESQKETAEKVARLNYRNWIAYICDSVAHLLHTEDTWAQFYEKKGIESLSEYINSELKKCAPNCGLYISRDGTGWEAFGSAKFYCYFNVNMWGICGTSARNWGTYNENKKEQGREWTKPQEPKRYTVAQYVRLIKELKELENKAKEAARKHHEKARESGLIYYEGGLADPVRNVWGKND